MLEQDPVVEQDAVVEQDPVVEEQEVTQSRPASREEYQYNAYINAINVTASVFEKVRGPSNILTIVLCPVVNVIAERFQKAKITLTARTPPPPVRVWTPQELAHAEHRHEDDIPHPVIPVKSKSHTSATSRSTASRSTHSVIVQELEVSDEEVDEDEDDEQEHDPDWEMADLIVHAIEKEMAADDGRHHALDLLIDILRQLQMTFALELIQQMLDAKGVESIQTGPVRAKQSVCNSYREALHKTAGTLIDCLEVTPELLQSLRDDFFISYDDICGIMCRSNRPDRVVQLLRLLLNTGESTIRVFVKALRLTKQHSLANILESQRPWTN